MTSDTNQPGDKMPIQPTPNEDVDNEIDQVHTVGKDLDIEPNTELQGYQDELGSGNQTEIDELQDPNDISPAKVLGMRPGNVKHEFDQIASETDSEAAGGDDDAEAELGTPDDRREHVEDMDEADKDRN